MEENISLEVTKYILILHRTVHVVSISLRFYGYLLKKHFHRITLSQVTSLNLIDLFNFTSSYVYFLCGKVEV